MIDLNEPKPQAQISLDTAEQLPQMSTNVASEKASKATYALNNLTGQSYQDTQQQFTMGKEQSWRQMAAVSVDNDTKKQYVRNQITPNQFITDARSNPNTILEKTYAGRFLHPLIDSTTGAAGDAKEEVPEHIEVPTQAGSNMIAIRELLYNAQKEMEALKSKETWTEWGTRAALGAILSPVTSFVSKDYVPEGSPLSLFTTRGQVPTEAFNFLPGNDLVEQSQALYRMPLEDASALVNQIKTRLKDNPQLAETYFSRLAGMSTDDRVQDNIQGLMDIATPIQASTALARKIGVLNRFRRGVKDTVTGAHAVTGVQDPPLDPDMSRWETDGGAIGREPVETTANRAAGNLTEAAVQDVAGDLVLEAKGKSQSQKRAVKALLSEHRFDKDALVDDPRIGTEERELATRLADATHRRDVDVVTALTNSMRPDRTPILQEAPEVVRVLEQHIKDDWKGQDNAILDIETRPSEITNNLEHEIKLGTTQGKEFDNRESAEANAKLNGFVISSEGTSPERKAQLLQMIRDAEERIAFTTPATEALETEGGRDLESVLRPKIDAWTKELNALPVEGYTIEEQGNGYIIRYTRPMSEFVAVKDAKGKELYRIPVNEAFAQKKNPKDFSLWKWFTTPSFERHYAKGETPYLRDQGIINQMQALIGRWRGPEEDLARETSEQRGIAAHATEALKRVAVQVVKEIEVPPGYWKDFNRVLAAGQHLPDPATGIPGYTFRSIPEFNNFYQQVLKRLPIEAETQAYFAWTYANDLDLALRRINLYTAKAIRGAEQFQFSLRGGQTKVESGFFEGLERKGLPGGDDNILVLGTKPGEEKIFKTNDLRFLRRKGGITKAMNEGRGKIIEVLDPDRMPFKHLGSQGDHLIRYVYVEGNLERKPLNLIDQLPRQGGGHLIPDYDHYMKQANIHTDRVGSSVRHILQGDTTAMPFADRITGEQITAKFNKVREILAGAKGAVLPWKAAKAEFLRQGLPMSWEEFSSWFKPQRNPKTGEVMPARFSVNEPFHMVGRDQSVLSKTGDYYEKKYGNAFVDGTRSGSIAKSIRVEFSGERNMHDLMTIADKGTNKNPIYSYQPANFVDPIAAQNRGLARIINSTWMNDVKIHSMNKWLSDAYPYINPKIRSEIWHSPYAHFEDGDKAGFLDPKTPEHIKWALQTNWMHTKRFLGESSKIDQWLHQWSQELADTIHGVAGPRLVPRQFLSSIKDPTPFIRSMTYAADMGLFSVKQFFTQATTFSNVWGLSPLHASKSAPGVMLHAWSTINHNPEVLKGLDKIATAFGYKPGQFLEIRQLAIDSGFLKVDEEHALAADHPMSAKVVKSGFHTMLDWGRTPFTLGAASVRTAALHTAYHEFRALNPIGRLTRGNKADILNRARLLDHNMSRASNSLLHTGVMSLPGQFFAYDLRLFDIMIGKRISPAQKMRLFATSFTLYGMAGAAGLYGFPAARWIQKKAIEEFGYVPGAGSKLTDFMVNGLPSMISQSVMGHAYDFQKFGSKGIDYLEDFLVSDASLLKIATGASGSFFASLWENSSNFYKSIMPEFAGGVKDMKMKLDYALDPLKTLASYNEAWKMKTAIHTGKWMSNNGDALVNDVSTAQALLMGLVGTPDLRFSDAYAKKEIMKDQEAYQARAYTEAKASYHRYIQAWHDNNDDAEDFKKNAFAILRGAGYPEHKLNEAIAAMTKGYESTVTEINKRYMLEAPMGQEQQRLDQFKASTTGSK